MEILKLILENAIATIAIIFFTSLGISEIVSSFVSEKCKCKKTNRNEKILKS